MTNHFSRRDFLLRAGHVGGALALAAPALRQLVSATSAHALTLADLGIAPRAPDWAGAMTGGLQWRHLGPFRGGRVAAATGVPGKPNEFYYGAVNGGVWKTVDAGRVWFPVFDSQPIASIGAIAVAPSKPSVVYVGSGESSLRDSNGYGNGMYKSVDAGKTWTHIGLADSQHIGKIAVDPRNPDNVFVAVIGHLYAANAERGMYHSRDGGVTWKKVLGDENVGAVEVVIDPANSQVVYAGLWNTRRPPWFTYAPTNGPGGGIFKSVDGGATWKRLTKGLPADGIGRTGIAVSPTNPKRVYAVVDCLLPDPAAPPPAAAPAAPGRQPAPPPQLGGFFRSDDAGATWTRLSTDPALWGRGWYFSKVTVDPKNADIVYVPNVSVSRSMDGGHTWVPLRGSPGGDDYHQAWISPDEPNTMIVASDQGAVVTRNAQAADPRDVTWSSWLNQATAQVYHVSVDPRTPYWVTASQQDSGAVAVRSRGKFGEISVRDWEPIGAGGESGYTAGDPLHPGVLMGGNGQRYDLVNNTPVAGTTQPAVPQGVAARGDWTQPLVFSRADQHALYYANQYLYKTTDNAKTWTRISEDLTRADVVVTPNLDAAAAAQVDRNGKLGVIYTIAPSPLQAPLLWVGTDDGLIHRSEDDGKTWTNVTPAAITPWSRITMIEASHFDANTAYATVDRHQLQDYEPYLYRTRDAGKSWQRITTGIPAGAYLHTVKEDHVRRGLLFAGSEQGVHVSFDDGDSWQSLRLNLPVTSMRDFEVYENDLILATHGRGFWVIDDISALRQVNDSVLASDAFLFKPADAVAYAQGGDNGTPVQKDEPQAQNPPAGAYIDYWLKSAPATPVTLEILDAAGKVLRTFTSAPSPARPDRAGIPNTTALWRVPAVPFSAAAGMHRAVWNPINTRGRGQPTFDGSGDDAVPVYTGTFTARLTVNGKAYTQSFTVKPDPRSA